MSTSESRLPELFEWLNGLINYERTGLQADAPGATKHDPARRLDHLAVLLELMDQPQTLFPSFHLTGTNGKTSTSRMISSLVNARGLSTGMYTSPHLEQLNERISVNSEPVSDADLAEALEAVKLLEPLLASQPGVSDDDQLSYFEVLTAAGFRHFADAAVEVGVIEVGVGGLYDATNVVDALVAVITNIGIDHTAFLGPTRRDIARHKAGVIKPGSIAVIGERDDGFEDLWTAREPASLLMAGTDFEVEANDVAVGGRILDLRTPRARYDGVFLSLHGAYQGHNAALAVAAVEAFFDEAISAEVVRDGLGSVTSPGRMEVVHRQPLCVLDGAHNTAGAEALLSTLDDEFQATNGRILVVGMLQGHEPGEMLPALRASAARLVIACTAPSPRAVPAQEIAAAAKGLGAPTVVIEDVGAAVTEALEMAGDEEVIVVTGSLYVVGAARSAILSGSQL